MAISPQTTAGMADRELVQHFESLGDNCEFGLVQRRVGAEPLGLLRFSSTPIRSLIAALNEDFAGAADPASVSLGFQRDEYLIRLTKYGFLYHTNILMWVAGAASVWSQQTRILPFLVRKLIGDLHAADKIFVFRQNEAMRRDDMAGLRAAIARFGTATLLWVRAAEPGHAAGSVFWAGDRFMVGHVRRLASRDNAPNLDLPSWLTMLRRAYALRREEPADPPETVTLTFGAEGNAGAATDQGWSPPEAGFTWSSGPEGVLIVPAPKPAPFYRLAFEGLPFVSPPALPSQRMEILVDGTPVHVFDPVPNGSFACLVPGECRRGGETVEIRLIYPRAASPAALGVGSDPRLLAVSFRSLRFSAVGQTRQTSLTIRFDSAGGAVPYQAEGWSAPEESGTWAVDDRSVLLLPGLTEGKDYRLTLAADPFLAPPILPAQTLTVSVNGETVHHFDPVPPGTCTCRVPAAALAGRDHVEIVLSHPTAMRPCDIWDHRDDRRLALFVRELHLTALD